MTDKELFKIWAPIGARWVDWVRPVPFISINDTFDTYQMHHFTIPNIHYIHNVQEDTALFIDLPSSMGVEEGIALANLGFRPIVLYNGTLEPVGAMPLVDTHGIQAALMWGALQLKEIKLADHAPPVFLLDSNRTHRFKMDVSIFDNSWDIYAQDVPSASYFMSKGIHKIIVRGEKIQKDVAKILYPFQKKGMLILFTDGYEQPKMMHLKKPSRKDK